MLLSLLLNVNLSFVLKYCKDTFYCMVGNDLFIKYLDYMLKLGYLRNYTSTSETLREASFNFSNFYKYYKFIDSKWLEWFIGFVEGDGSIFTYKDNNRISFIITQNESRILYHIKETLGFGIVKYDEGVKSFRFIVSDLPSLTILAHLFNGNLFLKHRIEQLNKWINFLQYKSIPINLSSIEPVKISLNDGWLSGFTDAEGCFNVHITKRLANTVGFNTKLRFILDQNDKYALEILRDLLKTGFVSQRSEKLNSYRYTSNSLKGFPIIVNYFNLFTLKTIKKEAFQKWTDIYSMMINKEHLNQEGFSKIKILAKSVNDKSTLNE
uniref:intronic ORF at intron 4 of cox1 n=1 Tax=Moniliophthora perniciosa TaxID=153609 RepID=UPI000024233D|nr:intronic ORF at intron 4 of cox1 [Moniliophthora perniciosa]AAQ74282.1 intronic ORF at intron 4 of cox1 [Moniliophthora perniciosa]